MAGVLGPGQCASGDTEDGGRLVRPHCCSQPSPRLRSPTQLPPPLQRRWARGEARTCPREWPVPSPPPTTQLLGLYEA